MVNSDFITEGQIKAVGAGWNRAPAFIAARGRGSSGDRNTILDAQLNSKMLQAGSYSWSGAPMDVSAPHLVGNRGPVNIDIPAGGYLFDCNQLQTQMTLEGIEFHGGAGVYRNRYTGVNVAGHHRVTKCRFVNQTVAVISHNSSDMPFWEIQHCTFRMASATGTMGVALSGLTDGLLFENNNFEIAQIGLKLGSSAANARITGNDFIRILGNPAVSRVDVWLVPKATNIDAGIGINIAANKFGNENVNVGDFRILFAGETGTGLNATRYPSTAASAGFVTGVRIRDNVFNGRAEGAPAPVTSRTPNIIGTEIADNHIAGNAPEAILKFDGVYPDGLMRTVVGPITTTEPDWPPVPATVPIAPVQIHDTNNMLSGPRHPDLPYPPAPIVANPTLFTTVQAAPDRTNLPKTRNDGDSTEFVSLATGNKWTKCFSGGAFIQDTVWSSNPMVRLSQNVGGVGSNRFGFRIVTDSPWLLLEAQADSDSVLPVTVKVNGQLTSPTPYMVTGVRETGTMAGLLLTFADSSVKLVEVYQRWPLARLVVATGSVWDAPADVRPKLYIHGDAWVGGNTQSKPWESFGNILQATTPWEVALGGVASTGYVNGTANPWQRPWTDTRRLAPITNFAPAVLVLVGSSSDGSSSVSAVRAAMATVLNYVQTNSPTTKILLVGPPIPAGSSTKHMGSLRQEAAGRASVIGVVDPIGELWDRPGVRGGGGGSVSRDGNYPTPLGAEWWASCIQAAIRQAADSAGITLSGTGNTGVARVTAVAPLTKTSSYTLGANDAMVLMNGSSLTATLPATTVARLGQVYTVKNLAATALTVTPGASRTIDGAATKALAQYAVGRYMWYGGTTWATV